jgi:hypothetical protein
MRPILWILFAGVIAFAGCKGKDQTAERVPTAGQQGNVRMDSMPVRDHVGTGGADMMPLMKAHIDSMMGMSPAQMSGMMAAHDRLMSQMMDRMGADMRRMNMSADAKWSSLMDSVRADLADLPGLEGKELSARMKTHTDRVQRLIAIHEGMMKGM